MSKRESIVCDGCEKWLNTEDVIFVDETSGREIPISTFRLEGVIVDDKFHLCADCEKVIKGLSRAGYTFPFVIMKDKTDFEKQNEP